MPTETETPEWLDWDFDEFLSHYEDNACCCDICGTTIVSRVALDGVVPESIANSDAYTLTESGDRERWYNLRYWQYRFDAHTVLVRSSHLDQHDVNIDQDYASDAYFGALDESYDLLCSSCNEERSDRNYERENDNGSPHVHDYGYRPRVVFHTWDADSQSMLVSRQAAMTTLGLSGVRSPASNGAANYIQQPFCGFELEMSDESGDMNVRRAAEYLNDRVSSFAYMKWDGSVDNGFELVTQPHTLDAYNQRTDLWEAIDHLRRHGWRSWNSSSSCGLHIHINNSSFATVGHAAFFIKFIYMNKDNLVKFAGRDSSFARFHYDSFVQRQIHVGWTDSGEPIYRVGTVSDVIKKTVGTDVRYLALNPMNENTYELRFFRGNMNPKAVRACLEFTFALHEYTSRLTTTDVLARKALSWLSFLSFVRKSNSESPKYRNLYNRLTVARRNGDAGFLHSTGGEE